MLSASRETLHSRAALLARRLEEAGAAVQVVATESQVGGGSVPTQTIPSWAVAVMPGKWTLEQLEERLRRRELPVIGRITHEQYILDVRTIRDGEFDALVQAVSEALA